MSVDLDRPTAAAARLEARPGSRRWPTIFVGLVAGVTLGVLGTIAVGALTGAVSPNLSGAAAEIPVLAQPQQQADALPTNIPGFDRAFIVAGSSRLVGQVDGVTYYLSRPTGGGVCLLILPAAPSIRWAQSCGDHLPIGVATADAGSARVVSSETPTPQGAIRLGLNVLVDPTSTMLNH
ncbi:hypothetical protein ACFRFH_14965 [Leifsonia sp. NPDC056824]|uniref:hypothetical protein n=1 Tax=Leifsonia sp. NPDC056824 TaxID=3345953 RepID=UPI0036BFF1BC